MFSTCFLVPGTSETVCANDFDVVYLESDNFRELPEQWQNLLLYTESWDFLRELAQTQPDVKEFLFNYAEFCAYSIGDFDEIVQASCALDELTDIVYNAIME